MSSLLTLWGGGSTRRPPWLALDELSLGDGLPERFEAAVAQDALVGKHRAAEIGKVVQTPARACIDRDRVADTQQLEGYFATNERVANSRSTEVLPSVTPSTRA